MAKLKSFRDLVAWQKAMDLVTEVYRVSQGFPKEEVYGLTGQMRRAAVSVPSNLAEGQGKASTGEFQQFLGHAKGSLAELVTQIIIARNLRYLEDQKAEALLQLTAEVGKLINGLVSSLKLKKTSRR
ncbi:MAG: four helix bundle protein [Deltaproteobacteria bacterium RBG_13_58_19]|nr:MAG: four helix bundle protein [Deltaproteobacteria bacterium RBG_13_58_19]